MSENFALASIAAAIALILWPLFKLEPTKRGLTLENVELYMQDNQLMMRATNEAKPGNMILNGKLIASTVSQTGVVCPAQWIAGFLHLYGVKV